MKSTQERSNECLPPKKRELAASTLASEERPLVVAPPPPPPPPSVGQQQAENLAWLASVAGGPMGASGSDVPQYKPLYSMSDTPSPSSSSLRLVSSLPTVYTSPVPQGALGGTIHYAQLPHHGLQFAIASPYATPYAPVHGYIAPPPPLSPSTCHRPSDATAEQQRAALLRASMPPPSTDAAPRTAPSPHHHHHHHQGAPHLQHPQHQHPALVPGLAQGGVLVHYTDVSQRKDERPRTLHNGKLLERSRRFDSVPSSKTAAGKPRDAPPTTSLAYEARHLHLSSDYAAHRPAQMLPPNSHGELAPPRGNPEKGGILVGKPVSRGGPCVSSSSSCTPTFTFPPPLSVDALKSSHTVIQTSHNATESLSHGLPSAGVYAQSSLLGYVAEGGPQQQQQQEQSISYHGSLPHHLLIPGPQPLIIPVSGVGVTTVDPSISFSSSSHFPTALSYVSAKAEAGEPAVVQAQLHLPVMPAPAAPSAAPPSLPPYFIKGSIIRLADGELKRVEELKTEDFIQSAEISSELKIDSSTVERIDRSHASPDFALVQFSVGEHRAQVSVEVLVEYPFFVFGQGWSSCCPDRTTQLLDLPCTKLSVGDVCISLTLKNLRNGSVKKAQSLELATPAFLDPLQSRPSPDATRNCSGGAPRLGEQENGFGQRGSRGVVGSTNAENGELGFEVRPSLGKGQGEAGAGRPAAGRKRRWSAPEGRKVERFDEEPPLTLPKPSFIPHELKVSIEGRSNIGK